MLSSRLHMTNQCTANQRITDLNLLIMQSVLCRQVLWMGRVIQLDWNFDVYQDSFSLTTVLLFSQYTKYELVLGISCIYHSQDHLQYPMVRAHVLVSLWYYNVLSHIVQTVPNSVNHRRSFFLNEQRKMLILMLLQVTAVIEYSTYCLMLYGSLCK